jgi:hypothetical protein
MRPTYHNGCNETANAEKMGRGDWRARGNWAGGCTGIHIQYKVPAAGGVDETSWHWGMIQRRHSIKGQGDVESRGMAQGKNYSQNADPPPV